MHRRSSFRTLMAMSALTVAAVIAFAHNGIEHVMGTVTSVTDISITVETPKHKLVTVTVDSATAYTHTAAKASIKDLKVGDRVVVNAKEGAGEKLKAVSVKWGATSNMKMPAGMKMPADHKM